MRAPCVVCATFIVLFLVHADDAFSTDSGTNGRPIWNETWTDRLKRDLFVTYDKFARPMQHYNTTVVEMDLKVLQCSVNEAQSTMTVTGWASHRWVDDKLKWDPADYGGIKRIHAGNHELWQPDIVLYNSGTPHSIEYYGDAHCLIEHNGEVLWVPPGQYIFFCDIDLRLWPFDTQTCTMKMGSWTYHGEEIDLRLMEPAAKPEVMVTKTEWALISVKRSREVTKYDCCEEEYMSVSFEITLKRNAVLYYSILMTPATAVVFLTLITFWLPPQSEMKVTVAACTTLIITVFLVYFGFKLPLTTSPPLIVYFYSGCLCQVTISLVLSVLVINMCRRTYCKPLPRNIRMCLLRWPGKLLGLSDLIAVIEARRPMPGQELRSKLADDSTAANSTSNIPDDCDRQNIISPTKNATQLEWVLAATAIDRVAFLLFCIILGAMAIVCMS